MDRLQNILRKIGCLLIQQQIYFQIVFLKYQQPINLMRPKQRIRKIYTQSDMGQRPYELQQNMPKPSNLNIKDLQLNLNQANKSSISDSKNNRNFMYKNAHFYMPNKFNKINRKQLIKKLPDINLASLSTISKPIKLNPLDEKRDDGLISTIDKKKNTFLLNSIFQILKPQSSNDKNQLARIKQRSLKLGQKKNISIDSFYQNEFINVTNSSTKNRGPKIIENEITRLSNHNNIMRRRIVSEEKSRPKFQDKSLEKLKETTFEHFKRCVRQQQQNQFNLHDSQPRQNFQNLEIITFYNKFPTLKKKQEEKLGGNGKESKYDKQSRPSLKEFKNKIKTEQNQYQEENQFIFQKK